jgi:hypothetical protein
MTQGMELFDSQKIWRTKMAGALAFGLLAYSAPCFAEPKPVRLPELPRLYVDTTFSQPSGGTIAVRAGGDFQAALNRAKPGDTITLQAGATFTGNFILPNKGNSNQWIVIRSSESDSLPPPGTRIKPSDSRLMPKIVTATTSPAIRTEPAANHYRFIGVEITTTHARRDEQLWTLIWLAHRNQTASQIPSDIIIDRCYVHGTPTGNVNNGVRLDGARMAVIDSYFSDFHEDVREAAAIAGTNGPGPFKIVNNYIEAAGENLCFGGNDPTIPNLVSSDIEIRGNHFRKPLSWKPGDPSYAGIHWTVKNLFELKNAQRVLIEDNIFENNWEDEQFGFAILFTVRNQNGGSPWAVVQDITFRRNIVRHSANGVVILGADHNHPSQQTKRILIQDNLFEDIDHKKWGRTDFGWLYEIHDGAADIIIDHNTGFQSGAVIHANNQPTTGLVYTNNITPHNTEGIIGGTGHGHPTLTKHFPGAVVARNVMAGGNAASYPSNNFFPPALQNVGFVDLSAGDYRLSPSSPFKNAGTDGRDLGADIAKLPRR